MNYTVEAPAVSDPAFADADDRLLLPASLAAASGVEDRGNTDLRRAPPVAVRQSVRISDSLALLGLRLKMVVRQQRGQLTLIRRALTWPAGDDNLTSISHSASITCQDPMGPLDPLSELALAGHA
ncbi:hypothetical protein [Streptomyces sp. NPDC091259]|uniref:hypothetical protein n=1 Tax=Streptomyces sp. NPDC091259 TaxID=3365976 RepID=UPI00382604F1